MSATPAAPAAPAAPRPVVRHSQAQRAFTWLLFSHLYMAAWFWGGALVVVAVITALVTGEATRSSVAGVALQPAMWFSFAMAIALSLRQIEPHVAAGLTRRSFIVANLWVVTVMAAGYAAALTLLVWAESLVVGALGWQPRHVTSVVLDSDAPVALLAPVYLLVFLTAAAAGLVVGMAYYRLGGIWGTLALVPALPPVFLVMLLLGSREDTGWVPDALDATAVRMLLAAGVAVVLAAVFHRLTRRVPLT